ncbi:MAG TPA: NAD(P)/FAD-dependent oxidoreductase [Pseudomonadales bacterium]|nr:NAD(P)/FAD-dependent oxidoreductase [Pseudomonadales bacterium]HMY96816.1 NAD(P)/FAD-dependent oxidoreductase [Pseudomonadales bacterium]HMZ92173.1 NAD(P)/FAD-dependent oxidoreductase [Pseudomonadales bacterium]HNB84173.1 NAD(P)/FAD-dependent oxidoreductase [Pseudomonadales bacterium]HNC76913.1 NAD(P)/FAD-dependent oxidoreductase [Pseudomonadales bacterium]
MATAVKLEPAEQYDAIIIGAGIAGMYQLIKLRELGCSVRVFETGDGVGGTWYWNRYPGARFDSESYSYGYSFSEELLQEWEWSEHFSPQSETLRYLNHVADKFDLRRDIQFNTRVTAAHYSEADSCWTVTTDTGTQARARFLITAVGPLSAATLPAIEGIDSFKGESCHTANWPHHEVDFTGKRVAVIGTGATGVQVIQEVAKSAKQLTVFQRRPNWCTPLNNRPITPEEQRQIKASYPQIFQQCRETNGCFLHKSDPRSALEVSPEEREAFFEHLYQQPGFAIWIGNFMDILMTPEANRTISDFIAKKIRQRVKDPKTAEKLIPTDHGFGTRRVPQETHYYEVYNQPNVELVSLIETPIERITPQGIKTSDREREFDIIIYATGFDAITGALDRIDIRGVGGLKLKDKWQDGPRTYLGLQSVGFPNLFTLVGPHNTATLCNIPRCIEQNVEWVSGVIGHLRSHQLQSVVPSEEAERSWTQHVNEIAEYTLFTKVNSWFTGVNTNVPGKDKPRIVVYVGGAPAYRERCDQESANGYPGFVLQ